MPTLDSMEQFKNASFNYSATRINELGASEYTLVTIVTDVSGSVSSYKDIMEEAIKESVNACRHSPRADNLMIRHITFNNVVNEHHGFKLLSAINDNDYSNSLHPNGSTALYDACMDALHATTDYAKALTDASFNVNAVLFIITDGCNNASAFSVKEIKNHLDKIHKDESLESLATVLVQVGSDDPYVSNALTEFYKDAGLNQYVEVKKANKSSLAKLAQFISKSISAQSQSLNSGSSANSISGSLKI